MSDLIALNDIRVEGIFRSPIKSCRQISLNEAYVTLTGLLLDHEYMVVDERNVCVSQRNGMMGSVGSLRVRSYGVRSMCLIVPGFRDDTITVNAPGMPELVFSIYDTLGEKLKARIWKDECEVQEISSIVSDWFTMFMSRERQGRYRLVRMSDTFLRRDSADASMTAFTDGFPFLITSRESHDELSRRAEFEVPTNRFRPTLILKGGGKPHFEDALDRIRIRAVTFEGHGLCDRCPMPGIDQETAEKDGRPLLALAKYRRMKPDSDKVQFGLNCSHLNPGRICVGDKVEVLKLAA
jgi:uncharacterized protein YcbX